MAVFKLLEEEGFLDRHLAGRFSYTQLRNPKRLLEKWTHHYRFSRNKQVQFYSEQKDLLPKMRDFLEGEKIPYALTLFSGAALVAPHVMGQGIALYLGLDEAAVEDVLWRIQRRFSLIPPRAGGNICFALPFYKSSIFQDSQKIKKFKVVSHLQLYLDLINYPIAGAEQATWLRTWLKEAGTPIIGGES